MAPAYGIAPETVLQLFHGHDAHHIAERFSAPDAMLFIARVETMPAGCLGFEPYDTQTAELQKFFVDGRYRGRGIGAKLLQVALREIERRDKRRVVLHTASYMTGAIALYQAAGFRHCPPIRPIEESVRHTEVFMSRTV